MCYNFDLFCFFKVFFCFFLMRVKQSSGLAVAIEVLSLALCLFIFPLHLIACGSWLSPIS